jgi:three-Cys-motif partner protein
MALEFVGDAISLSGLTGSKLKSDVIGDYYPFWWRITSGGVSANHEWGTAIVELDAATGEMYIKETGETILGSAGHALALKCTDPNTKNLKVVLVEKDPACYDHLKRVIAKRWKRVDISMAEGPHRLNSSNVYLMNKTLDSALSDIGKIRTGNSLFFFDPLRGVEYETIEKVARERVNTFYKRGTEFIIFVFTSDWFLGRDDFSSLPRSADARRWTADEHDTVLEADALFGDTDWRDRILNDGPVEQREKGFIGLYKTRLHKWFRYVLPLPFNPKADQLFHLILCSNFDAGVRATRSFYSGKTGNPKYSPDNRAAFDRFRRLHPGIFAGLKSTRKPAQWRILWKTIVNHEEGLCDSMCSDFEKIQPIPELRQELLEWLQENGYLVKLDVANAWKLPIQQYELNWPTIKERLGVDPPLPLEPLSSKEIAQ